MNEKNIRISKNDYIRNNASDDLVSNDLFEEYVSPRNEIGIIIEILKNISVSKNTMMLLIFS